MSEILHIDKSMIQSEVELMACDQFAVRRGFAKVRLKSVAVVISKT